MIPRKRCCPKCGYELLARYNNDIICLSQTCDRKIESKRDEDITIPEFQELKDSFN